MAQNISLHKEQDWSKEALEPVFCMFNGNRDRQMLIRCSVGWLVVDGL